jgi:hypothetical protein
VWIYRGNVYQDKKTRVAMPTQESAPRG